MAFRLRIITLAVGVLVVSQAGAAQAPTRSPARPAAAPQVPASPVVFLGPENNPPFISRGANGAPVGFAVELMQALGREGGFDVAFYLVPRQERGPAFRLGRGDVTGVELNTPYAETTIPLVPLWRVRELALFTAERTPAPASIADLKNDTVAVVDGSQQHLALLDLPAGSRPRLMVVQTMSEALQNLRRQTATAVLGHSLQVKQTVEYAESPRFFETEIRSVPYFLAARAGREDLQPLFAAAYLRLQESGELTSIIERTMLTNPDRREFAGWVAFLLIVLGVGALALLGMGFWSRSLHREVQRRTHELHEAADRQPCRPTCSRRSPRRS